MISLILLALTTTAKQVCSGTDFCLSGTTNGTTTIFTLHSAKDGWAAYGSGSSQMSGSKMVIGFKDSTNTIQIGNFDASGHVKPSASSPVAKLVSLQETPPSWAKLSFSVQVPSVKSDQYIWASSSKKITSFDGLTEHESKGVLGTVDFTSEKSGAVGVVAGSLLWLFPVLQVLL